MPALNGHFKVEISGFKEDLGFESVAGLTQTITSTDYFEGGENTFAHRLPNPITYADITLKRGMVLGSDLINWFAVSTQAFIFLPRDVTITLMDNTGATIDQWVLRNAWAKSWTIDTFDSKSGAVLYESIVLAYQYFYRKGLKP